MFAITVNKMEPPSIVIVKDARRSRISSVRLKMSGCSSGRPIRPTVPIKVNNHFSRGQVQILEQLAIDRGILL